MEDYRGFDPFYKKEHYVIGLGASAGGLESLNIFFNHTPNDGVSYVIVQHLPPNYQSWMSELLQRHSKLRILEITDGMEVEPNCIYLMRERKYVTMKNGRLFLTDNENLKSNSAIDVFLDSLAEDAGSRSIGIILSGTGADGTKGISAIKKKGGLVIVEDPATSRFGGMANSAISTGNVDMILPVASIPDAIVGYLNQNILARELEVHLHEILELIQLHTPLDFTEYKRPTIIRRIIKRMNANNVHSLPDYIKLLKSNVSEIETLSQEFLISVTSFFRDPEAFEVLRTKVIPDIIQYKLSADLLKVWVVGCATGEEAYSIAMLIKEYLTEQGRDLEVKIFASDVDKEAIAFAAKGMYPESVSNDIPEERFRRFFVKDGGQYKVNDEIRKMVIFAHHDIIKQPPYGKIDFVTCRNLLIYLNPALQNKVFSTLHFCLNLGGYMFLGSSENLGDFKKVFAEVDKKWKIYKNIKSADLTGNASYSVGRLDFKTPMVSLPSLEAKKPSVIHSFTEIICREIMEETGFAGVCVDEHYKIIKPFGAFKKYLLPEMFNFNLLEMVPEELSVALGVTLSKAVSNNKRIKVRDVVYLENNSPRTIHLSVLPFLSDPHQKFILILFNEERMEGAKVNDGEKFDKEVYKDEYVTSLEQEIRRLKGDLLEAHEALHLCNDNAQSFNEELLSSNEEMQSTNEELQSVNEELQAVNNEHNSKIKQLAEVNDDLNNFFRSTINGQVFLDRNLVIRKFTPAATKQINLKDSDVGRPLSDISTNIKLSNLIEDVKKVLSTFAVIEKEVETTDNKWYQMNIIPYVREHVNITDGVIISFNDITALKKAQDQLMKINADHDTFIYSASHDLKNPINNIVILTETLGYLIPAENKQVREITDLVIQSAHLLTETVNEMANITKMKEEIIFQAFDDIDLNRLIEDVKFSIKDLLSRSKAKIHIDLKESKVRFSKKNLRSILTNLLTNAVKYRSAERQLEINISTSRKGEFLILSVQDNGIGIGDNKKDLVFAKFRRVSNEAAEGTGIGLYLVKQMMMNAGGRIELESELGKGSCFKVYFKV